MSVGLSPQAKGNILAAVPTIFLKLKKNAYPPHGHNIYETNSAKQIWEQYQQKELYPDRRGGKTWKPLHKLDPGSLQYVVQEEESLIVKDKKTQEIIAIVIRHFSGGKEKLLEWINGIIEENTGIHRNVRVGSISNFILACILNTFSVGRPWSLFPDWLHCWCMQQPSTGMGTESGEEAD